MKPLSEKDTQRLMSFYQQGNYHSAVDESKKLINCHPGELILHNILGVCLERQGLFQEAAEAYQDALKINPAIPELQFNMGAMLHALDRWDDAIIHYKKALDIKPNFIEAFFNMGITFQSQANFDEAIKSYENALKLQPGFYEAIGNIGTIKQLQGDLESAIKYFEKALNINEDARGHYNLAGALRNHGNLSMAIDHYKKAIKIGSNEPEFYSDLGDALWHNGQIKEANQFLRSAVEMDPSHSRANYQLAIFLYDNKMFEEAIKYFEASQFQDWEERTLYCFYKLENFDQFEAKLKNAIIHKNSSPFLATLSTHYSQNMKIEDLYNFCPNPLNFVCHEKVPELIESDSKLLYDLIYDINTCNIGERKQKRLSYGIQSSGNLFKRPEKSFKSLEVALSKLIKNYFLRFKDEPCEFINSFPEDIEFSSSWFVKMQSGGHLSSHIHEDGWISGAVYLSIPKIIKNQDEGGIELSTDGDEYPRMHDNFPKKVLLPEAGDVIFFPSSVFHRTIPFDSDEERICIAFDLKPGSR
ncbi:MAG: tetratricopeptide repeat protein [Methylophilaceae bacterium]|nr:tetratricopeptide repeat protein [Methylophilaceae bacterium]